MSEQIVKRARPVVGKATPVCHEICPNHFGLANDLRCTLDRGHAEAHRHHLCEWLNLDYDSHIANLEWRVVEAAVAVIQASDKVVRSSDPSANRPFDIAREKFQTATRALIAAREAAER